MCAVHTIKWLHIVICQIKLKIDTALFKVLSLPLLLVIENGGRWSINSEQIIKSSSLTLI